MLKMHNIPVFAGLGSDSLFSQRTLDTAAQDAKLPESKILLRSCHRIFLSEVAKAVDLKILTSDIKLEDFEEPHSLIQPLENYHHSILVQHMTLYLVQLLRYIRCMSESSKLLGVAGFCAGLLPALAVASSNNLIELLSQGQNFFYIAFWLGSRNEEYRQQENARIPCQPNLPWSVVIDGLSPGRAKELLTDPEKTVGS